MKKFYKVFVPMVIPVIVRMLFSSNTRLGQRIILYTAIGLASYSLFLSPAYCDVDTDKIQSIAKSILFLRDSNTGLAPSHWGHPGYEDLAFLYDKSVDALILKAAGFQKEAEEILDYFADCLDIPIDEVIKGLDSNGIFGIIKFFKPKNSSRKLLKTFTNGLDITSRRRQGSGLLEFYCTPGPLSFLTFAMLAVNPEKYQIHALTLGEALLAMQNADGGVQDGDRAPNRVHTEPHMDAYAAFLMLHEITRDIKWRTAAEHAYNWFEHNVYHPEAGAIDQGYWSGSRNTIFAEDVYSWTMAGPAGDRIPIQVLKRLTTTMLKQSLVKITIPLPDSSQQTVILCDFSNPEDPRVKQGRGGFHPMGSVEWTGGAILALQKNATRLWNSQEPDTAIFYKAIAEALLAETMKCFYFVDDLQGKITFYATGQGIEVGPFGSIGPEDASAWKTPFFYAKTKEGTATIKGGSLIGAWPLLPYLGLNPFILNDRYRDVYNQIPLAQKDREKARLFLDRIVAGRSFTERIPINIPDANIQIVEPRMFVRMMWKAFEQGNKAKENKDQKNTEKYFKEAIMWALKVANHPAWIKLAKRDNIKKKEELGGIVYYPWDTAYKDNEHPLHYAIWRYPLLNEIGVAMWGLATAYFELGDYNKAKYWIGRIIEDVPLHQIAAIAEDPDNHKNNTVIGYWNALFSWENNLGGPQMRNLYLRAAKEKGLKSALPKIVEIATAGTQDDKLIGKESVVSLSLDFFENKLSEQR